MEPLGPALAVETGSGNPEPRLAKSPARNNRLRAYAEFLFAVLFFLLVRQVARHAALDLTTDQWFPLFDQAMLAAMLVAGYAVMGLVFDRQPHPIAEQGLPLRTGWPGEAGLGVALGWALALVCVLPLALDGGIAIRLALNSKAWGWLVSDAGFFALAALAEEVAFRGYGFQRFADALGSAAAALSFAAFYAILQIVQASRLGEASLASVAVSMAFGLLLAAAYLRTRALWVSWGLNFGWKATRALLFGLTISGNSSHSPVVQGDPMGPFWLTGGGFGLDGSWLAVLVFLAAMPVIYSLTRDLDFRYNAPVIVPAGIPVDLEAAARRQHEAAMGSAVEPATPALVQIAPATPQPAAPTDGEPAASNESL